MRVAVFHGAGKPITIEDVPDDPLPRDAVRIEVGRCGICGSDVSLTSGSAYDYPTGCRLGHESAGTVIEVGPDVASLKMGDRLAVFPRGFCGHCRMCREGRPMFCENGPAQTGGFGERLIVIERAAFRFPDSVTIAEGALVEPIACARRAFRMARMSKGDTVLVIGAGSMGLAAVFWARQMGAERVVVATRTAARHPIALAMGADATVIVTDEDPEAFAREFPEPPCIVVEGTGKPGALQLAAGAVRMGGTVVSLGLCAVADPVVPAFNAFKEISFFFPIAYSPEDFTETIRAFDAGAIHPRLMVTEVLPLTELPQLIEDMRRPNKHLKVQIVPNSGDKQYNAKALLDSPAAMPPEDFP